MVICRFPGRNTSYVVNACLISCPIPYIVNIFLMYVNYYLTLLYLTLSVYKHKSCTNTFTMRMKMLVFIIYTNSTDWSMCMVKAPSSVFSRIALSLQNSNLLLSDEIEIYFYKCMKAS